jgi:allantoate deiminase
VIPALARFSLDIRSPVDALRDRGITELLDAFHAIAGRRRVTLSQSRYYDEPAASCDPVLVEALKAAVRRCGLPVRRLPSGAGHDGLAMVALCPIGMLFVRCKGGISHNPAESIRAQDAGAAVAVLIDFLRHHRAAPH